jgi:hypothetical protein
MLIAVTGSEKRTNTQGGAVSTKKYVKNAVAAISILFLGACAGTAPKPNFGADLVAQSPITASDHAQVKVEAAPEVRMENLEKQRLSGEIASRLEERRAKNATRGDARSCNVVLTITRYERGNAFARAMLAGLGQIHIDGSVKVFADPSNEKIQDFNIAKTFAWGGIYGASTSMQDIERTFADGVAATLTGQQVEESKTKAPSTTATTSLPKGF